MLPSARIPTSVLDARHAAKLGLAADHLALQSLCLTARRLKNYLFSTITFEWVKFGVIYRLEHLLHIRRLVIAKTRNT